jgi:hypothetical protein
MVSDPISVAGCVSNRVLELSFKRIWRWQGSLGPCALSEWAGNLMLATILSITVDLSWQESSV